MKSPCHIVLLVLLATPIISASGCTAPGARCRGAEGREAVPWDGGCCRGDCDVIVPGEWGTFCPGGAGGDGCVGAACGKPNPCVGAACGKPTPCYATGERAQGAPGFRPIVFKPCCVKSDVQVEKDGEWGKWCMPVSA